MEILMLDKEMVIFAYFCIHVRCTNIIVSIWLFVDVNMAIKLLKVSCKEFVFLQTVRQILIGENITNTYFFSMTDFNWRKCN